MKIHNYEEWKSVFISVYQLAIDVGFVYKFGQLRDVNDFLFGHARKKYEFMVF